MKLSEIITMLHAFADEHGDMDFEVCMNMRRPRDADDDQHFAETILGIDVDFFENEPICMLRTLSNV